METASGVLKFVNGRSKYFKVHQRVRWTAETKSMCHGHDLFWASNAKAFHSGEECEEEARRKRWMNNGA